MDYEDYSESESYEEDDESTVNGYSPEQVRDPNNIDEWYEAVVTEVAWQTGRVLYASSPMISFALFSLANQGASPAEAADFIICRLKMVRCE